MAKRLLNERAWLLGEIETPTIMDLLRDVVYAEQDSPQQLAAIDSAWRWLNPRSIKVEVTCAATRHSLRTSVY
jgi:hypothetical protein